MQSGWDKSEEPTEEELRDALFCWKVAKFVKSNAIVYAKDGATVGRRYYDIIIYHIRAYLHMLHFSVNILRVINKI